MVVRETASTHHWIDIKPIGETTMFHGQRCRPVAQERWQMTIGGLVVKHFDPRLLVKAISNSANLGLNGRCCISPPPPSVIHAVGKTMFF